MCDDFGGGDFGLDIGSDVGGISDFGSDSNFSDADTSDTASFDIDSSSEDIDNTGGFDDIEPISDIESFDAVTMLDAEGAMDLDMEILENEASSFISNDDLLASIDIEPFNEGNNGLTDEAYELTDVDVLDENAHESVDASTINNMDTPTPPNDGEDTATPNSPDDWFFDEERETEGDEVTDGPVLMRDQTEQWEIGLNSINNTVEAMRDDLRDKGHTDEQFIEQTVAPIRAGLMDELSRNIEGDFSNSYEMPDFNSLSSDMEDIVENQESFVDNPTTNINSALETVVNDAGQEENIDTSVISDTVSPDASNERGEINQSPLLVDDNIIDRNEATSVFQQEHEVLGNETDSFALAQEVGDLQSEVEILGIQSFEIDDVAPQIEQNETIDGPIEIIELLEDVHIDDESADAFQKPFDLIETISADSNTVPDDVTDIAFVDTASTYDEGLDIAEQEQIGILPTEETEPFDERDTVLDTNEGKPVDPLQETLIDYETVYDGLDEYDFDGIDCLADSDRLDGHLDNFTDNNWEGQSLDDKKDAIESLKGYVQDVVGLKNPPEIVYYNKPNCSDYGRYDSQTNTLEINTYSLEQHTDTPLGVNVAQEAADTVAHELWHAYQHQCAENPRSGAAGSIDHQRQFGLNNYISPQNDAAGRCINFEDYQDQLVESEARAFADQFKGRLAEIIRRS